MSIDSGINPDAMYENIVKGVLKNFRVFYNKKGRFLIRAPKAQQQQHQRRRSGKTSGAPPASTGPASKWRQRRPQAKKAAAKVQLRPAHSREDGPQQPDTPPPARTTQPTQDPVPRKKPKHRAQTAERTWPAGDRPPPPVVPPPAQVVSPTGPLEVPGAPAQPSHIATFLRSVAKLIYRPRPSDGIRIFDSSGNLM